MSLLLVTAAIQIEKDTPHTFLTSTQKRLDQYKSALIYIIENIKFIDSIIFCDNTGYQWDYAEIELLGKKNGKCIEFLVFQGDREAIKRQGKGFGEGKIIKYILENSRIIDNYATFYKLTGRVIIKNFNQIIQSSVGDNYFISYPKEITGTKDLVSTLFYKVNVEFYKKYLIEAYKDVRDSEGLFLEMVFYKKLEAQHMEKIKSFPTLPLISGMSGSTGIAYDIKGIKILKDQILNYFGVFNIKKNNLSKIIIRLIGLLKKR